MTKVRQDAWSHEDDLLLAETVLRHVREGSTQLNAFEEVGDKLNRTSAACGFRWNAEVRSNYVDAMELAKRQRKERKRAMVRKNHQEKSEQVIKTNPVPSYSFNQISNENSLTMDKVIHFLHEFNRNYHLTSQSELQIDRLEQENKKLVNHVDELEKQLKNTEIQLETIKEDYQTFIQIMERARKMTVFEDQDSLKAPTFRMDKNGNLEQLVQGLNQ